MLARFSGAGLAMRQRKPGLPPSAFLLDMADARLENTLSRAPQKKTRRGTSRSLSQSQSQSLPSSREIRTGISHTLPSTVQCGDNLS